MDGRSPDEIRKQIGKRRAEGEGCESWMCSKACGQVVSRARACGSRGITSRITSRGTALRPAAVALSLSILPYFVTLLPRRSQLCLCRCHDYHRVGKGGAYTKVSDLSSFLFATTLSAEHGVNARFKIREALAPFAKGLRRYVRNAAKMITFHCRALFCNLRLCVPF